MQFRLLLAQVFRKLSEMSEPALFTPRSDDVYLVSYPRSGNTWMRVILSELLYGESGRSIKDLQYYIPDIHVKVRVAEVIPSGYHVVKSHFPYNNPRRMSNYRRVVYLVRDPRDVVLSYYRYMTALGYYNGKLEAFLPDWLCGRVWPCSWQEHVNSWTGHRAEDLGINLLIIRYEDLLFNAENEISRLASFLALDVSQEWMRHAITSAYVQEMRAKEERGMRREERAEGFQFVGAATSGQWQNTLTAEQVDQIISHARNPMERHGYL